MQSRTFVGSSTSILREGSLIFNHDDKVAELANHCSFWVLPLGQAASTFYSSSSSLCRRPLLKEWLL